ncbi:MAG TPA: efflux RND transporter periplasmic adaptor subunit, partial [Chthonomonadales bacterium]|nr:efflux RND transporter periplasmic adaptor subunit [Chthonomonadales bacterium]
RRRIKRGSRTLPSILGAIAVAGIGWWAWSRAHPAVDPNADMITGQVTRGDLTQTISATGSITAQTGYEVKIGSQITGVIRHLYADVGSHVTKGELIAELDLPDLRAQYQQAEANLASARMKLAQDQSGLGMVQVQTAQAISQAQAALNSAKAKLQSSSATASQTVAQTPTDIARAQTGVGVAQAALSTALSTLKQTQAGVDLQIGAAKEQVKQAQANANLSSVTLKRQQALLAKGYVAGEVVDTAAAQDAVNQAQVASAQQNLSLVTQKTEADLQSAQDAVTQARQNLAAAKAALTAAHAETFTNSARLADVSDSRAAVSQAMANLEMAEGNRANDIIKKQLISQDSDAVQAAAQQVAYNKAQLDKSMIRSPIDGTVLQLAAQQGETLAAGLSAPTLIIVCNLNKLQADVFVDETDIGSVRLGQRVDITVDAFPKHTFRGRVFKIAAGSTIEQGVVTYDVSVAIDQSARFPLKPDMTVSATIKTGTRKNVLLVPSEAVKLGRNGATVSVVVKKDGKQQVVSQHVRTGASDGVNTEIKDGLTEGQTVVLASMSQD